MTTRKSSYTVSDCRWYEHQTHLADMVSITWKNKSRPDRLPCESNPRLQNRVFFTPATDVFVLAVAHYDKLCKSTSLSMVAGMVDIEPIWRALGKEKAQALSIFHAFTGADNVRKFSGMGKHNGFSSKRKLTWTYPDHSWNYQWQLI